jgi:membrane-bound metal-dependent hydrolase YbcI (DUF457 family)
LDNLTHTLFAFTLARTALGRAGRGTTAALAIASNAPDLDIIAAAGGAASYLRWHRGPTHGPIGILGLGLATAAVVWLGYRIANRHRPRSNDRQLDWGQTPDKLTDTETDGLQSDPRNSIRTHASFMMLAGISTIGGLLHVLMDLPTSYGTRPLSPFDWHWYAVDWMPIIDIYLLIALGAGLAFSRITPRIRRYNALIVLTLMAANYGLRGVAHHQALLLAPRLFGPALPQLCQPLPDKASVIDRWPRADTGKWIAPAGSRCLVEIAAIPTFLSPFKWRVLAQMSNAYEVRELDLLDRRVRDPAADVSWRVRFRYPNQWAPVVERAAATGVGQVFLGFSRFPAARWVVDGSGVTTVRWEDMRFASTLLAGDQPVQRRSLFTAIVRLDPDGRVIEERLGR